MHCLSELRKRYDSIESLPERSLTVCSGLDMVNITLNHFIFSDKETTEVSKRSFKANKLISIFFFCSNYNYIHKILLMGRSIILVLETRIEKINEQCQNEQCVSKNELRKTVSYNRYEYAQFASIRILHFSVISIFK